MVVQYEEQTEIAYPDAMTITLPSAKNASQGGEYQNPDPGTYLFRCVEVADPMASKWDPLRMQSKITWEIQDEGDWFGQRVSEWVDADGDKVPEVDDEREGILYHSIPSSPGGAVYARVLFIPEQGPYVLELVSVGDPQPNTYNPKMPRYQFTFRIVGGDWEGFEVRKRMTLSMNEKSHLAPFAKALLGADYADDESVEISNLIGRRCQATIVHSDPDEKGRIWPNIGANPVAVKEKRTRTARKTVEEVPF